MNRLRLYLLALTALIVCSAKADEGMWLLQLMQQQHSIDMMKKQGLKLEAQDLYNPNGVSLKDAVGIFGGGCTGEIISPEGLILTNHHCGYASIQQHSSVEHDYLTDGFWATSRDKELPTPGLKFTFIERIEDVTDIVNAKIAAKEITESESFSNTFLQKLAHDLYFFVFNSFTACQICSEAKALPPGELTRSTTAFTSSLSFNLRRSRMTFEPTIPSSEVAELG